MELAVIIPAAGGSTRFNASPGHAGAGLGAEATLGARSKLDEDLGGRSVLQRTVELFNTRPETCAMIVAGPHDPDAMSSFKLRHADMLAMLGATLITGGATHRWQTVAEAIKVVPEQASHIAVHDGARPACPVELIDRVLDAARQHGAVVPVLEVDSTAKRLGDPVEDIEPDPLAGILGEPEASLNRAIVGTVDRDALALAQTPQVFERELLERAYAQPDLSSTDDAGLIERLGEPVVAVLGDPRNIKVTRPIDLNMIRRITGWKGKPDRPSLHKF
ncbi:MAG: 2-C-methyl-D-erythritol 4-phosphate cytidylyltransferase [Planctomycetota bacterium]